MLGTDVVVAELTRLLARLIERMLRGGCPASWPLAAVSDSRRAVAFLRGLLAGPEELPDLRPRQARSARLGHEALDQLVCGVGELAPELDCEFAGLLKRLMGLEPTTFCTARRT
jgi:hypothetical protein